MARQDVLVSADWLHAHVADDGVVVVECDEDTTAYDVEHIEGAVKLGWKTDLQDPVRRDLLSRAAFEELLSAKGITADSTVILYGGNST